MERGGQIDKVLKAWLDNVIVPVMVRQYLAACSEVRDNGCRPSPSGDADNPVSEHVQ
jgi:hypothetical protein